MNQSLVWIIYAAVCISPFILALLIWLFDCHGIDRIKYPEEWKDQGSSGERIVYKTLIDKFHVPENQILRNLYVPKEGGGTSEIDLLVVSKKGLLVFECKNYAGRIYGDGEKKQWIQYLGGKKSYFYNPFMQNRSHIKHLKKYLGNHGDIPMIPMVATIKRGVWKVRNYGADDNLLGYNSHLADIIKNTPDSEQMAQHFNVILKKLQPLSRPDESIRKNHIKQVRQ